MARLADRQAVVARSSALLCACALSGCFVTASTGQRMQNEIWDLQKELEAERTALEDARELLKERISKADGKLQEVTLRLSDITRTNRMSDVDFGAQMERMIREMQELRGALELADYRLGQLELKLEKGDNAVLGRLEALEKGGPAVGATEPPTTEPGAKKPAPDDPRAQLAHGKKLLKTGKDTEARGLFREIVRKWPEKPGITDDAYFRLGEIYYNEKNYQAALREYIKVVEKFSSGKIADDAYYRIGVCSLNLGNYEDAQIFFNEIISNYKGSPLIKYAKEKLGEVAKLRKVKKSPQKSKGKQRRKK